MVNVRIVRGLTIAGTAALSIPALAGCAADSAASTARDALELNEANAGSGELRLNGYSQSYFGTDEFVRVGQTLTVSATLWDVVARISEGREDLRAFLLADASRITLETEVVYVKADDQKVTVRVPMTWRPESGSFATKSEPFVIPAGVKLLNPSIGGTYKMPDGGSGSTRLQVFQGGSNGPRPTPVFGAFLPNKLALFDSIGGSVRTRVIEGGALVKGARATFAVSDWRLESIVKRSDLDVRVGQQYSGNRFGPTIVDLNGAVDYEVDAVFSTDGGQTFQTAALRKNTEPQVLTTDGFRFTLEGQTQVPENAGPQLVVAFHVRAFLQVPESRSIINPRYAPGARILLKDVWDNNGGANYALPVGL